MAVGWRDQEDGVAGDIGQGAAQILMYRHAWKPFGEDGARVRRRIDGRRQFDAGRGADDAGPLLAAVAETGEEDPEGHQAFGRTKIRSRAALIRSIASRMRSIGCSRLSRI